MGANLEAKKQLVQEIEAGFKTAKSIIFVDYRGISVGQDTALRKEFRSNGVTYKVYKNRLLTRALDNLGIAYDAKNFEGTTAVAFSEDEIVPAKIFCETATKLKKMEVKFGVVNGETYSKEQVETLAKIPAKPVLIAMLLGMLNAPVSALARGLNEIAKKNAN